nr:unnamed protein product [Callosobruchus analis]
MTITCSSPTPSPSTSSTKTFNRQSTTDDAFKVQRSYECKIFQYIHYHINLGDQRMLRYIFMVCKDNYPLSMTERECFKRFLKVAVPLYKPPSRSCVSMSQWATGFLRKIFQIIWDFILF